MASVLAGFRPVKHLNGSPFNGQVNRYTIPAGEATVVNIGDFVVLASSDAVNGYPAVERAASGTAAALVGVVVGFQVDYSNLNTSQYRVASTERIALVADATDILFAGPQDGVGGVIAAASVGLNVAIALGSTSTTAPYASGMTVDSSTVATTNTLPLKVMGITDAPDNDITSTSRPAEVLVMINTHQYAPSVAGV